MARTKGSIAGSSTSKSSEYNKKYMKEYYLKNSKNMNTTRKINLAIEKGKITPEKAALYGLNADNVVIVISKFSSIIESLDDSVGLQLMMELQSIYEANKCSTSEEKV
jgi:hypothetical protein